MLLTSFNTLVSHLGIQGEAVDASTEQPLPCGPLSSSALRPSPERAAPPGGTRGCEDGLLAEPPSRLSAPRKITERLAAGSPVCRPTPPARGRAQGSWSPRV